MNLNPDFEEQLFNLHVGCVGIGTDRHERPHKPLLLLTILDLIATGKARRRTYMSARSLRTWARATR